MKFKPLYMYGIIFVLIIAVIIFTSSNGNKELTEVSSFQNEIGMPNDAVHQGMNGTSEGAPSKSNVRGDFWTKLEKSKADLVANPNDTLAMKNYAQVLGMSHQTEKAIKLYEKILSIDPNRVDILLAEGLAFYNDQNYKMAEVVTKKIIVKDDKNLEAKYNLGVIAASQGKDEEAIKIWEELSQKYPDGEIGKLSAKSLEQISQ